MRLLVSGALGRMGREIISKIKTSEGSFIVSAGVDISAKNGFETVYGIPVYGDFSDVAVSVDCAVDFSVRDNLSALLSFCDKRSIPAVIGTTGLSAEDVALIERFSEQIPVFYSANMSKGIRLMQELMSLITGSFDPMRIEITENHHIGKADAPSGTALSLFEAVKECRPGAIPVFSRVGRSGSDVNEVCIHSYRLGGTCGSHEAAFSNGNELFSVRYDVFSLSVFAKGALEAVKFIVDKENGLYGMSDLSAKGVSD